ncbi:Alkaline protease-like protein [Emericellopsis cladophorae]|uniref:Alkaline protease-like protein n=1 Tax=Emericellopsis cladophorae TaxID=2686198 RepID=A0A9Q0BEC6_9HYPO|nr:Alkaline protease-like protein [Emericellopsis cladophorae]KAI6782302.1 Alkaline protease-like protein [Emericellopsis cladophorae]
MSFIKSLFTSALLVSLPLASALPHGAHDAGATDLMSDINLGDLDLGDIITNPDSSSDGGLGGMVSTLATILSNPGAKEVIPNRYIVVYNNTYDDDAIEANVMHFTSEVKKRNLNKRSLSGKLLSTDVHSYKMNSWRAMTLDADDDMIMDIFNSDEVEYVEADTQVHVSALLAQTNAPVGLNRLSASAAGSDRYFFDSSSGEGITAFVVDTGVKIEHTEFGGRATRGANFVPGEGDDDLNGHGSHVAGTIAGSTFGVAKAANVVAVKVLGADGGGSNSGVIDGMQWIIDEVESKGLRGKAVMNMSLGGGFSEALNRAIEQLFNAGVVPVVAAGNDGIDTRNSSPGSAPNAITVGAMDARDDTIAAFSNTGPSVDVFASGVDVQSVGIRSNTDTAILSGTSMASPHVAGLAAYLMAFQNLSDPAEVDQAIKNLATNAGGSVRGVDAITTDLIANNGNTFQ